MTANIAITIPVGQNINFSHLDAIQARLRRERERLATAETAIITAKGARKVAGLQNEIDFRKREIASAEREEIAEYRFLGIEPPASLDDISDDDLLAELTS